MTPEAFAVELDVIKVDLRDYLSRLLLHTDAVDDVLQSAAVRALSNLESAPAVVGELRPWVFRIATNLAIDEIRRRGRWRGDLLLESRPLAEANHEFVAMSESLRGSPQMRLIAKEHLVACFACTLRALTPERAAALLLREVYAFSVADAASILDARPAQVKNWLQEARRIMTAAYENRCALIRKTGICYQCSELAELFTGQDENPLASTRSESLRERVRIVRELRNRQPNPWHQQLFAIFDELE